MRKAVAILFFTITFFTFLVELSGNHGNILFRPWMKEDWIIWGIIIFSFLVGAILLFIKKAK